MGGQGHRADGVLTSGSLEVTLNKLAETTPGLNQIFVAFFSSSTHSQFRCSTPANRDRPLYHSSYTRWSTSKLNYIAGKESSFTTPGTSPAHSSYSIKSLASSTNGSYNTYRCIANNFILFSCDSNLTTI